MVKYKQRREKAIQERKFMEDRAVLKAMRKEANMTQKQFARYFGIPIRTVEDWERGLRHMPDYLMRLLVYKMETEGLIKKHPEWEDVVREGRE